MTFTEAAVQILRVVGRPLHYKKITELAIEQNLLSHVGKTPEVTMSSRLATMVRKDRGEAPILKVKPGVFGLREFDPEVLESALGDTSDEAIKLDASQFESNQVEAAKDSETSETSLGNSNGESLSEPGEAEASGDDAEKNAGAAAPLGSDVFPEEDDDDEPILGSANSDDEAGSDQEGGRNKRSRSRRRRREGRKAGVEARDAEAGEDNRRRSSGRNRERDNDLVDSAQADQASLADMELADAIEATVRGWRPAPESAPLETVAEMLIKRGRLAGSPSALVPTISAAVRGDNARRELVSRPPRFRIDKGGLTLARWFVSTEAARSEDEALKQAQRQRQAVHRGFLELVRSLAPSPLMELMATWLNAEGVLALRAVRRPSSRSGEFHLAGTRKVGAETTPIAILVVQSGTVTRDHVIDLRGAMHHYGQASAGWIVACGQVDASAKDEASTGSVSPCMVLDGEKLAEAFERCGVGLRKISVPLSSLDLNLLDSLLDRGALKRSLRGPRSSEVTGRSETSEGRSRDPRVGDARSAEDRGSEAQSAEGGAEGTSASKGRRRRRRRGRGANNNGASLQKTEEELSTAGESPGELGSPEGQDLPAGHSTDMDKSADKDPVSVADATTSVSSLVSTSSAEADASKESDAGTTTTESSDAGTTTTESSSDAGTTTTESSDAGTTTTESSDAGTTTTESSDAGTTTTESSDAGTTTTESSDDSTASDSSLRF